MTQTQMHEDIRKCRIASTGRKSVLFFSSLANRFSRHLVAPSPNITSTVHKSLEVRFRPKTRRSTPTRTPRMRSEARQSPTRNFSALYFHFSQLSALHIGPMQMEKSGHAPSTVLAVMPVAMTLPSQHCPRGSRSGSAWARPSHCAWAGLGQTPAAGWRMKQGRELRRGFAQSCQRGLCVARWALLGHAHAMLSR